MNYENNQSGRPTRKRIFCMYFITSAIISTIIYCCIVSHIDSLKKIENLQNDVKYIFKELSELARDSFKSDSKQDSMAYSGNDLHMLNGDQNLEKLIAKHTDGLKEEWAKTQRNVDVLMLTLEKKVGPQASFEPVRTDFASESLGAQIVQVDDTPYIKNNYFFVLLGLAQVQNEPRNVLRSSVKPGDCYAFKGNKSTITIRLMTKVFVDSVTVEHIPASASPSGDIKSAPKEFAVYGLRTLTDEKPFTFGSFTYDISNPKPAQVFAFTQVSPESFCYIQFRFLSNNGHANFTCVYRLSVHGRMDTNKTDLKLA